MMSLFKIPHTITSNFLWLYFGKLPTQLTVNQIFVSKLDLVLAQCLSALFGIIIYLFIIFFIISIGCHVLILRIVTDNMTFMMVDKTTSTLHQCIFCELFLWNFLLVQVGVTEVWPGSHLSTHLSGTNMSFWLHRIRSRHGVFFAFCNLSTSGVMVTA